MSDMDSEADNIEEEIEELEAKLQEIKDQEGIIGYILRSTKSASIDLKDPTKMISYALLSSTMFDTSQDMIEELKIGEVNSIVVESEETKILSMNINDKRLSIFMEKNVNHDKLYKKLI
jgi:predicted regulator of Ras-like GTPase activity (Roadblock/LC7/MglB family)